MQELLEAIQVEPGGVFIHPKWASFQPNQVKLIWNTYEEHNTCPYGLTCKRRREKTEQALKLEASLQITHCIQTNKVINQTAPICEVTRWKQPKELNSEKKLCIVLLEDNSWYWVSHCLKTYYRH